jgi:hypothetical protein
MDATTVTLLAIAGHSELSRLYHEHYYMLLLAKEQAAIL